MAGYKIAKKLLVVVNKSLLTYATTRVVKKERERERERDRQTD